MRYNIAMDWYEEGRRWCERYYTDEGHRLYGGHPLTHARALLKRTRNSTEWLDAHRGFYGRLRELNQMPFSEFEIWYNKQKGRVC